MTFSTLAFTFSGMLQTFTAFWFYRTKNQDLYFYGMIIFLAISLITVTFLVPESPVFLLQNDRFEELEICLYKIGKINGITNPIFAKYSLLKL